MYTKLQMILGVVTGVALAVFIITMIAATKLMAGPTNPADVPRWVGYIAWGTFGVMFVSCIAVMVTIVMDEKRLNRPQKEEEPEKSEESEMEAMSGEPSEEGLHTESHDVPEMHEGAEAEHHAATATSTVTETAAFESLEPLEGFEEE